MKQAIKRLLARLPVCARHLEWRRQRYQRRIDLSELRRRQEEGRWWLRRIRDVIACPDNAFIPRHRDAGRIVDDCQIMHNGLRIARGSYDGLPIERMLRLNRGVHEPQEERVFAETLRFIPRGGTMLELGAYWGFYSLWFASVVPGARNYLVDPSYLNLNSGRLNFLLNGRPAVFRHAFVGSRPRHNAFAAPTCSVDQLMSEWGIPTLHVLHSDIQGREVEMLDGSNAALGAGRIDFAFLSTHGPDLHARCLERLRQHGLRIIADVPPEESYSVDGLIAARRADVAGPPEGFPISRKGRGGCRGSMGRQDERLRSRPRGVRDGRG